MAVAREAVEAAADAAEVATKVAAVAAAVMAVVAEAAARARWAVAAAMPRLNFLLSPSHLSLFSFRLSPLSRATFQT